MIDVTIIVPVYNVESYLERCLDSLVNQTYDKNKYEIYVINDSSKDKSLEIVKKYMKKYSIIKLKDLKNNKGVSNARNIGIRNARGKYLLFCDSDDYYELNALEIFMNFVKKNKADFVMANYSLTNGIKKININSTNYFSKIITKKEAICYMTLTSCSKLIKRDLFVDNNIYYPEDLKKCEELTVIPVIAYLAKKPMILNCYLYNYYQRQESASNNFKKGNLSELNFFDESYKRMKDKIDNKDYFIEFEFRYIDHIIYGKTLVMLKSGVSKREILKHINDIKNNCPNFKRNKYLKKYSFAKKMFVYMIYYKLIVIARLLAYLHKILIG